MDDEMIEIVHKTVRLVIMILLIVILYGCSDLGHTDTYSGFSSRTLQFVKSYSIGMWPNSLYLDKRDIYIVDSGNNEIDVYHIDTDIYENSWIKLPTDSNPVQVSADDEHVYIIASNTHILYQYDKITGTLITLIDQGLDMPYSLISSDGCHTIVNSEYDYIHNTAGGYITYYCGSNVQSISSECKNPVSIQKVDNDYIVTCSGVFQYDSQYNMTGSTGSALILYDSNFSVVRSEFNNDDPGSVAVSEQFIVSGSAYKGTIHLLDHQLNLLDAYHLNRDDSNVMLIPRYIKNDLFVIADFNHDMLIFIHTEHGKIGIHSEHRISDSSIARKGPLDIIYDDNSHQLFILNSLSETLDIYLLLDE